MEDASISSFLLPQTLLLLKSIPHLNDYDSTELLTSLLGTLQQDGFTHYNGNNMSGTNMGGNNIGYSHSAEHSSQHPYQQPYEQPYQQQNQQSYHYSYGHAYSNSYNQYVQPTNQYVQPNGHSYASPLNLDSNQGSGIFGGIFSGIFSAFGNGQGSGINSGINSGIGGGMGGGDTSTHYLRRFTGGGRRLQSTPNDPNFALDISLVFVCIICAGFASGLTQGLLSLDYTEMTIKMRSGTPDEKKYAAKVLPIISRHHLLLVSLMLWNAAATEALPIFLSGLVPEYLAIIISVTLVLFVGEIIPAAILTGPNQLYIAANLLPLVYVVFVLFFPIAYPISLGLDYFLGHDEGITLYNRKEIATMINIQHEEQHGRLGVDKAGHLHIEEVTIIDGALKFRDMVVEQAMTPVRDVFMLPESECLTYQTLSKIFNSGYSRIPVYGRDRSDVIGLILTKDLIFLDPEDETPVSSFVRLFGRHPVVIWHDQKLGETLTTFRKGGSHMAIVRIVNDKGPGDPFYEVMGIITLEDIIEEILGAEIEDETDVKVGAGDMEWHSKRDADLVRLQLLKTEINEEKLSPEEVKAVAAHLLTNLTQIETLLGVDDKNNFLTVCALIQASTVLTLKRSSPDPSEPMHQDTLYRRGKMTNSCTLILAGKVSVFTGKDNTRSEAGPWTSLAADSLILPDGCFLPDFSAHIVSDTVRILRINVHSQEVSHILPIQQRKTELGLSSLISGRSDKKKSFQL